MNKTLHNVMTEAILAKDAQTTHRMIATFRGSNQPITAAGLLFHHAYLMAFRGHMDAMVETAHHLLENIDETLPLWAADFKMLYQPRMSMTVRLEDRSLVGFVVGNPFNKPYAIVAVRQGPNNFDYYRGWRDPRDMFGVLRAREIDYDHG